jgi:hypothetical protein
MRRMDQLIVQLPMGISNDDLALRHRLEELLQHALKGADLGSVDGGDIGSGNMNVFAFVTPDRWDDAQSVAVEALQTLNVAERAVIARSGSADDEFPTIVWPAGVTRQFTFW